MYLPKSEILAIDTLAGIFSDMSESYKIFWFNGILDGVNKGNSVQTFEEIINHMITDAWYMVTEYHLNLGPADALERLIHLFQKLTGLPSNAKKPEILLALEENTDREIQRLKKQLTLFVPYRLQAPFMKDFRGKMWESHSLLCERINSDDRLIYTVGTTRGLAGTIEIQPEWMDYLYTNYAIVSGWVELCMIRYLQRRNPSVPGLADKIRAPEARKLKKAKDFWNAVVTVAPIRNIYADGLMTPEDLSLDHFVPWSFVAHDELWNLVPTTKAVNSSKSNDLPNWDRYFPGLCQVEYEAYRTIWQYDQVHTLFEKCIREHVNSNDAMMGLYQRNIPEPDYRTHLENLLRPTWQAAKNQGFTEWNPSFPTGGYDDGR